MKTISHDAFARQSIVRTKLKMVHGDAPDCAWCGKKYAEHDLYRYGIERDDRPGRIEWQKELFCSVGCMRAYHS